MERFNKVFDTTPRIILGQLPSTIIFYYMFLEEIREAPLETSGRSEGGSDDDGGDTRFLLAAMTTIGVFCDGKEGDVGDSCRLTDRGCTTGLLRGCKIGCCPRGRLGGVGSRRSSGRATPDIGGRKLLDAGSMVNVFIDA